MFWNMGVEDAIADLIDGQMNSSTAKRALLNIGIGACEKLYAPASAAHLVLVYSSSEYAFTSTDLSWLESAETVVSFRLDQDINVFFVEMTCDIEDYYVEAAAVVKVFNIAFPTKNVFVFRVSENVALGIARDPDRKTANNFAITGLINVYNFDLYEELLYELPSSDYIDLPPLVINNSPQEQHNEKYYDGNSFDPDYLSFLSEFESFYGVDTSRARDRFLEEVFQNHKETDTYKAACEELRNIAEAEITSSYEDLDAAQLAEEKTKHVQVFDSNDINSELPDRDSLGFSEEAFQDAEQMLKEMLQKDK